MFVLDCSVTMSWCFEDEANQESTTALLRFRDEPAIVPAIWNIEVCNVLINAKKKKRITQLEIDQFMRFLGSLPIEVDCANSYEINFEILALCKKFELSAYDACYLELALRYKIPLVTFDKKLNTATDAIKSTQ